MSRASIHELFNFSKHLQCMCKLETEERIYQWCSFPSCRISALRFDLMLGKGVNAYKLKRLQACEGGLSISSMQKQDVRCFSSGCGLTEIRQPTSLPLRDEP